MAKQRFDKARKLIEAANSADPNLEISQGKVWPKALLYSHRMSDMLERYAPDADDAMKLAVSAQHIQRWQSPRSGYPMNRRGYHQWRAGLYEFHANTVADLLAKAGYEDAFIARVAQAVGKKSLTTNPDTQLLEDVAGLVFLEHYLLDFADKHPEYDQQKWLDIIRKIWNKLSVQARQYVLAGHVSLPEALAAMIRKAVSE
ncbi:MAG TPA: DUF4202 domain-containing protein [Nitrosomonas halophila]|nr:DUF4202 domain-containing protein [Nitrosomonas halophila]